MVVRKWDGGKVVSYIIFDTTDAECGATTTLTTTADLYEVTPDGSLILSMPADFEALEKCPLSKHPFDTVKLSFGVSGVTQNIIKKAEKPLRC